MSTNAAVAQVVAAATGLPTGPPLAGVAGRAAAASASAACAPCAAAAPAAAAAAAAVGGPMLAMRVTTALGGAALSSSNDAAPRGTSRANGAARGHSAAGIGVASGPPASDLPAADFGGSVPPSVCGGSINLCASEGPLPVSERHTYSHVSAASTAACEPQPPLELTAADSQDMQACCSQECQPPVPQEAQESEPRRRTRKAATSGGAATFGSAPVPKRSKHS